MFVKTKNSVITLLVIFLLSCIGFYLYTSKDRPIHQKCPDEYGTDDAGSAEYLADFDKWTNNFYEKHPGAILADFSNARFQFWENNNCIQAIQRYREAKEGNVDHIIMDEIENSIKKASK